MNLQRFFTVLRKEVLDNLRDRRTLFTAMLFGPLFGPVMLVVMVNFALSLAQEDAEQPLELPVVGQEIAPNLLHFLRQHNTDIQAAPADPEQTVRDGEQAVVLIIPPDYAEQFKAGKPGPLQLVFDSSDQHAQKHVRRARHLLESYGRQISALRLQARGINPLAVMPLAVQDQDVASAEARAAALLGMLPYFIIFAALMGGFYLAIDTTAGERERGSLEPLLTTAASRSELLLGKLTATALFAAASLIIALLMLAATVPYLPLAKLGMASSLDAVTVVAMIGVGLPFAVMSAALLTLVASFTKSFKEAQTWLSFVLIIPIVPSMANMLFPMQPTLGLMAIPIVSQNILLMEFLKGAAVPGGFIIMSAGTTLVLAGVLAGIAAWLYRRERVLG